MSLLSQVSIILLAIGILIPSVYTQSNFPPVAVWEIGQFSVSPSPGNVRFCNFTDGASAVFGVSGDTVILNAAENAVLWAASTDDGGSIIDFPTVACSVNGPCLLTFGLDGNLVATFNDKVLWSTGTQGRGMWFVCSEIAPWLYIVNGAGAVIWSTSST